MSGHAEGIGIILLVTIAAVTSLFVFSGPDGLSTDLLLDYENIGGMGMRSSSSGFSQEGTIIAFYGDDFELLKGQWYYFLKADDGSVTQLEGRDLTPEMNNARIRVSGNVQSVSGESIVQVKRLTVIEQPKLLLSPEDAGGPQKIVVLLANFQDNPIEPYPPEVFEQLYFYQPDSVNAYYTEVSFGQSSFQGIVDGWYTLNMTRPSDVGECVDALFLAIEASDPYINFQEYDRVAFHFPIDGVAGCGTVLGFASVTPHGFETDEGLTYLLWSVIGGYGARYVVIHEQGHNFGIVHAKSFRCEQAGDLQCTNPIEMMYGDSFDVMGKGLQHVNARFKNHIGWVPNDQIENVSADGVYEIGPLETTHGNPYALRIFRNQISYYYVFLRTTHDPYAFQRYDEVGVQIVWNKQFQIYPYTNLVRGDYLEGDEVLEEENDYFYDADANGLLIEYLGDTASDNARIQVSFGVTLMYGDVNQNGAVTQSDVQLLDEYLQGEPITFSNRQRILADVSLNGVVTIVDLEILQNYVSGLELSSLPVRFGDVNSDLWIDIDDVMVLGSFLSNIINLTPHQLYLSDLDGDDSVDHADKDILFDYIGGYIEEFPVDPLRVHCVVGQPIGDANEDEDVTQHDVFLVSQIVDGLKEPPENICCVDVDDNGEVQANDVALILEIINGEFDPGNCLAPVPSHTYQLAEGWNLISPVFSEMDGALVYDYFPNTVFLFVYDGGYRSTDILQVGKGYWQLNAVAESVVVEGESLDSFTYTFAEGNTFYLIGAPFDVDFGGIGCVEDVRHYDSGTGGYYSNFNLEKGVAAFIKISYPCTFTMVSVPGASDVSCVSCGDTVESPPPETAQLPPIETSSVINKRFYR